MHDCVCPECRERYLISQKKYGDVRDTFIKKGDVEFVRENWVGDKFVGNGNRFDL